jgi:hypothetical protein
MTVSTDGVYQNLGIPSTGISQRHKVSGRLPGPPKGQVSQATTKKGGILWFVILMSGAIFALSSFMPTDDKQENIELSENDGLRGGGSGKYYVTADRLNRRTCRKVTCGIVGWTSFREAHEVHDGWARVTKRYDASCEGSVSSYVDSGNAACASKNGIVAGEFAEWVSLEFLTKNRPPDPSKGATGLAAVVGQSDDYRRFRDEFVSGAKKLISEGKCTEDQLKATGGFIKSVNKGNDDYFSYCGDVRIYLNVKTGSVFQ